MRELVYIKCEVGVDLDRIKHIPLDDGGAAVEVGLERPDRIKERMVAALYT